MNWDILLNLVRTAMQSLREKFASNLLRVSIVLAILLIPNHQIYDAENNVYDLFVKFRFLRAPQSAAATESNIALILIDDEARRLDKRRWLLQEQPTSRLYLASLIDKLAHLDKKPAVIGVDFRLDRPASEPKDDATLAQAIENAIELGVRVVLGTVLIDSDGFTRPLLPLDLFLRSGSVTLGFTNFVRSSTDHVVRQAAVSFPLFDNRTKPWWIARGLDQHIPLLFGADLKGIPHHWSFASALLSESKQDIAREIINNKLGRPPFWIDFSVPGYQAFHSYSSAQLLEGQFPKHVLESAIVILAASYDNSPDRIPTPLSTSTAPWLGVWGLNPAVSHELPGATVHAYAARTLMQQRADQAPFHSGPWILVSMAILIGSMQVWAGVRIYKFLLLPESALVLPALFVIVSAWLFEAGYGFVPVVRPVAAYLLAFATIRHFLCVWRDCK